MYNLITPFGEIQIRADDKEIPIKVIKCGKNEKLCPDVLGLYRVEISFIPDGKKHIIRCEFIPDTDFKSFVESGENLECQSFYNDNGMKMSIGLEGDSCYNADGKRIDGFYDYDVKYLKKGMAYSILPQTKTQKYVFGIAWINEIGSEKDKDGKRDIQTWFGADPTISMD
ncbi:MAG: hypothetical protein E7515_07075 [Ruminococcaceae bacterium]|nr:hypothetical protein [Oscillospiraceae bacterium]